MVNKKSKNQIPALLSEYMELDNIAEQLSSHKLNSIGETVITEAKKDDSSRANWKKNYEEALKIATQIIETKNSPWPNAANIKFPLILNACIQFNARTNPEIIQGDKVVNVASMKIVPDATDAARTERLSTHMSYQLLGQSENWRSDTDKLLMTLPLVGVVYRKTYFDSINKRPQIDFCLPSDIIVHNEIESLEKAPRITHILHLSNNDLLERMRADLYLTIPIEELESENIEETTSYEAITETGVAQSSVIEGFHDIFEQHTFLDLDDDGYAEPYIITVHAKTQKVLRIVARFNEDSFVFANNKKDFVKINPILYFTDYHFIPAPDGTFHSLGYGQILYPINDVINSTLNQLLDAGTLANRGGGFISKSLRIRKENIKFKLGEYIQLNVPTGMTLAQNIYPMPVREPSQTLFNLLSILIQSGKEIASISDIMLGQPPAPNTPATTVMAIVEQGTKIYSSMLNRLYYSFKKEFEKLYELNKVYLEDYESYQYATKSGEITLADYRESSYGIFPVADPSLSSEAMRLAKIQALLQFLGNPLVDDREILRRYFEGLKIDNIDKLLPAPQPQGPTPADELTQSEIKYTNMQAADILMRRELEALRLNIEERRLELDATKAGVDATSDKINAISKLALTDAEVGKQEVELAEKQFGVETAAIPIEYQDIKKRLNQLEQIMQKTLGGSIGTESMDSGSGASTNANISSPSSPFGPPSPPSEMPNQANETS